MPSYGGPIISQGAEEQAHRTILCSQPQAQPTASSWPPQSRIPIAPLAKVLGLITVPGLNSEPKKGSALTQTLPPQFPAPTLATLPHGLSLHPSNVSSCPTWEPLHWLSLPFSLKFCGSLAPSSLPLEF